MLEEYRYREYCDKRLAWSYLTGLSPSAAAIRFEKLVKELAPRYAFWPHYPFGPSVQFQMAVKIQALARKYLASHHVKAQQQKVRHVKQLHLLGLSLLDKSKEHFTGMEVIAGYTMDEAKFSQAELKQTTGLLGASKKLCLQKGYGGFVVAGQTAYFCIDASPFTLRRYKTIDPLCTLYLVKDTPSQQQAKINDYKAKLVEGIEVLKRGGGKTLLTLVSYCNDDGTAADVMMIAPTPRRLSCRACCILCDFGADDGVALGVYCWLV